MREMKDSGISWLGKIPTYWEVKRVKHGFYRKKGEAHQDNPRVLSLARTGVKERDLSNNEGQIAESYYNYNPVDEDDLLINPMDLYSGANCSISKTNGVISPAYVNLRYKEGYYPDYYDYYFKIQYWLMAFFAHGKGVSFDNRWTLNADVLMNYPIIVPPYTEQIRQVDYLKRKVSLIDTVIAKKELVIEKLKEFKSSVINEAIIKQVENGELMPYEDFKKMHLGECIDVLTDYHSNGSYEALAQNVTLLDEENYALMVRTLNLERNDFSENVVYIDEHAYNFLAKSKVFGGEIIINKIGSAGKVYYMPILGRPVSLAMNQFLLRLKEEYDSKYVYYYLHTKYAEEQIAQRVKGAVTLTITKNAVRSIPVLVPGLEKQKEIAKKLDDITGYIDSKCKIVSKQIEKLEEYKKSLIFEVVTGKKEV